MKDELLELRKQKHNAYLEKKKKEDEELLLKQQQEILESSLTNTHNIEEDHEIQEQLLQNINNTNQIVIDNQEEQHEDELQQEQEELDENEDEDGLEGEEEEEEELQQEPPLQGGLFGNGVNPLGGMNPFGGMMQPNFHGFNNPYQPFQAFQGSGNQLNVNDFGPNPSLVPNFEEFSRDIRAEVLSSGNKPVIDDSGALSPTLPSSQKKIVRKLQIKSLVDLCIQKLSNDLQASQMKLKLLPPDLIHRLIENMNKSGKMTKTKINQMMVGHAKIYELNLNHQYHIVNNDFLLNSLPYMKYVEKIYFHNCGNITDVGMEVFRRLNNLLVLDLRDNRITDVGFKNLKTLLNLQELYLRNTLISDKGVQFFELLLNLKVLDLSKTKITDLSMPIISNYNQLSYLNISDTLISDKGIQMVTKLPITELFLSNCFNITNQGLFFITYLGESLRTLDIAQTKINGIGLNHFRKLGKLSCITLPGRENFNDSSVNHLNFLGGIKKLDLTDYINVTTIAPLRLERLVELSLSNTKISDDSLVVIRDHIQLLEVLTLDRTLVTDQGIVDLKKLSLLTLSLMSTRITGACLKDLSEISTIQSLNIAFNNGIDDKSIKPLTQLQDLIYLDIRGTKTTNFEIFDKDRIQIRIPVADKPIAPNPHFMGGDDDGMGDGEEVNEQ